MNIPRLLNSSVLAVVGAIMILPLDYASAADCAKDHREVRLNADVLRLREYTCRTANEVVRVQFHRLSNMAASLLLNRTNIQWIRVLFGTHKMVENAVGGEFKLLLSRYGFTSLSDNYGGESVLVFGVDTPLGGTGTNGTRQIEGDNFRMQNLPYSGGSPVPNDTAHIRFQLSWPAGYQFFYTAQTENAILNTILWRYASRGDLSSYSARLAQYHKLTGEDTARSRQKPKYNELIEYVTRSGMPTNFIVLTTNLNECGLSEWADFELTGRAFLLDVMSIENDSSHTITIDDLLGKEILAPSLRAIISAEPPASESDRIAANLVLAPGERVIIPIRIFVRSTFTDVFSSSPNFLKAAQNTYRTIRSAPPQSVFSWSWTTDDNRSIDIRKVRESFGPPALPSAVNFSYGPELKVSGLQLNGTRMTLEGRSANFLNMTAEQRAGSCPILYTYNASSDTWDRVGKILHDARGSIKESTHIITFGGVHSKFKLAEEELEISFIRDVKLRLELIDGSQVEILPTTDRVQSWRNKPLRMGDELELSFLVPEGIQREQVVRSMLYVTGYYKRYLDLPFVASREMMLRTQLLRRGSSN
jgi:hypothetical protein